MFLEFQFLTTTFLGKAANMGKKVQLSVIFCNASWIESILNNDKM